jgi:hypothetical protein
MLPGMIPLIAGGSTVQAIYIGGVESTTPGTTHNFGNFDLGPGDCLCVVAMVSVWNDDVGNFYASSVTIGGSAAERHAYPGGGGSPTAIASRVISGGGVVSVSVGFSVGPSRAVAFVWALRNVNTTNHATESSNTNSGATSISHTIAVPRGGVLIAAHGHRNNNAAAWTNANQVDSFNPSSLQHQCAIYTNSTNADIASHAVTCTWTTSNHRGLSIASWAPA